MTAGIWTLDIHLDYTYSYLCEVHIFFPIPFGLANFIAIISKLSGTENIINYLTIFVIVVELVLVIFRLYPKKIKLTRWHRLNALIFYSIFNLITNFASFIHYLVLIALLNVG